jgi:hypothetical protein
MGSKYMQCVSLVLFSHQDTAHYKTTANNLFPPRATMLLHTENINTRDINISSFRLREVEGQ